MRIEEYELEILTPPCDPGAERYAAIAHLSQSLADALPYLHAVLAGANYHPSANALTWQKADHFVAFHADRVAVSNIADREEAVRELDGMIALVNRTWEQREAIVPNFQAQKRPSPVAVYRMLPRTNCRKCGQATCMAFAVGLIQGQLTLAACPHVADDQRAALVSLL